jgi:hypothetical protein
VPSATTKVTATLAGTLVVAANGTTVGSKLDVLSTKANDTGLRLGAITPASDAKFVDTADIVNVTIVGPDDNANLVISGATTVTD